MLICVCIDDRAVRDTERKAALMHFDTEQVSLCGYGLCRIG